MSEKSESVSTICENCPRRASIESALAQVEKHSDFHKEPPDLQVTIGWLAMWQEVQQEVSAHLNCIGPQISTNNLQVCPIDGVTATTMELISGPAFHLRAVYDYEVYSGTSKSGDSSLDSGQYL